MRRTVSVIALTVLTIIASSGCGATAGAVQRPPDVAVAQIGTDVLKAATLLQNEVNRLTAAGTLPVALRPPDDHRMQDKKVSRQKRLQLSTGVLKAYHAATSLADRSAKAAEVQALITTLSEPLSSMLGVKLPAGAAQSVSGLIGAVMQAVGAVQSEIAKGLSGMLVCRGYSACRLRGVAHGLIGGGGAFRVERSRRSH